MSTDIPENADAENDAFLDDDGVLYDDEVTPEVGVLGFTLRELLIVSAWLVGFVVSFFPLIGGVSIWGAGIQWILPIGVPTAAVFLIVLRRFSPEGIRRVGSLGIDQFASVAFSVSAVTWVASLWAAIASVIEFGVWTLNWAGIVQLLVTLVLMVLTVFAPLIPALKEDFHGRLVTLAHRNANPVRPVVARPRTVAAPASEANESFAPAESPAPVVEAEETSAPPVFVADDERSGHLATDEIARFDIPDQLPLAAHASGGGTGTEQSTSDDAYVPTYSRRSRNPEIISDTGEIESFLADAAIDSPSPTQVHPDEVTDVVADDESAAEPRIDAVIDPEATHPREPVPAAQPFWILAPSERDVHDERGAPLFRIGPQAWALVIEDRGGAFVVRHDDGRIGYLHDISDITKG